MEQGLMDYSSCLSYLLSAVSVENMCTPELIDGYYASIVHCLLEAANLTIPQTRYRAYLKPYWNEDLTRAHREMRERRATWMDAGRPKDDKLTNYKASKKNFRALQRKCISQKQREEYEDIDQMADMNTNKFWVTFRKKRQWLSNKPECRQMKFTDTTVTSREDIVEGWAEYFSGLYSPLTDATFDAEHKEHIEALFASYKEEDPTPPHPPFLYTEVAAACKKLKKGKAPGFDGVESEHIKYGGAALLSHLHRLFNGILSVKYVPKNMKLGTVITLLKDPKKSHTDPNNYRGISLLPIVYKVLENLFLVRLQNAISESEVVFPDPLQNAYRKNVSCVNLSLALQECVRYNVERGSKVYACFLDTSKAFDVVWHPGLFVKLRELGISDALWHVIVSAYTGMESQVRVNGLFSRRFPVLQSVRQGGVLSPTLYLLYINGLIEELRASGLGCYMEDIYCGVLVQADDVALLALSPNHLQKMINICYEYSIKWRYRLNPSKTQTMVFGETMHTYKRLSRLRHFKLGDTVLKEVQSVKHVGIILNRSLDTKDIAENACQKGRGSFAAVVGFGARTVALNPLTSGKVYRQVVIPSTLYGAELWCNLTNGQSEDLEKMQRFCLKVAQGLIRTTRSDMCHTLLGMPRISAFIDKSILLFLQRLCKLPENAISKQVFVRRLEQVLDEGPRGPSVVAHLVTLADKYGLSDSVTTFRQSGVFPGKAAWKRMVIDTLVNSEKELYYLRTSTDSDFVRFHKINPDCFTPSVVWAAAKGIPDSLELFRFLVKLTVEPLSAQRDVTLCEFCGTLFADCLLHRVATCCEFDCEREKFWGFITDNFPIDVPVGLHNLPDDELVEALLGSPVDCTAALNDNMYGIFLYRCGVYLHGILS